MIYNEVARNKAGFINNKAVGISVSIINEKSYGTKQVSSINGGEFMNIAVRYYSRSGNTKAVADAIAKAAGVSAVSVDQTGAAISDPVDILFIGGALYAYGLDNRLKEFLKNVDGSNVKKAVVFSTSWISKHALDLIKNSLAKKGIIAVEETFYVKNKPNVAQLKDAESFAKKFLS